MTARTSAKTFLFLQGPHGPFFHQLARRLKQIGHPVWRVGFNGGDAAFWPTRDTYIPFRQPPGEWQSFFEALLDKESITDLVLYGDARTIHAEAIQAARARGIRVHVFEEGYLRPYWITYERDGANGNSKLMDMSVAQMQAALTGQRSELSAAPARWGEMRQHIFYGAFYHFFVFLQQRVYPNFRSHRQVTVAQEFRLYVRRFLNIPLNALRRAITTLRIKRGGFPYHLVLLQLAHDMSFKAHSGFSRMEQFVEVTLEGFSKGAPQHHHLVFKAHPLEDGREPLRKSIEEIADRKGLSDRVHFVNGGKLAHLLDTANTAVTVNSTAAQQALWRGLPIKVFGEAVYNKPEFVSPQSLASFFADPEQPDGAAYHDYRVYLLRTSQVRGGFYARQGRRHAMRKIIDLILSDTDPYESLHLKTESPQQQLRLVATNRD
ncbi:MAG: capsular biosynthesis protein [Litoreibacter sp.]|nr:capsular biosynthesis protein [Litoreibacter sp.]